MFPLPNADLNPVRVDPVEKPEEQLTSASIGASDAEK